MCVCVHIHIWIAHCLRVNFFKSDRSVSGQNLDHLHTIAIQTGLVHLNFDPTNFFHCYLNWLLNVCSCFQCCDLWLTGVLRLVCTDRTHRETELYCIYSICIATCPWSPWRQSKATVMVRGSVMWSSIDLVSIVSFSAAWSANFLPWMPACSCTH